VIFHSYVNVYQRVSAVSPDATRTLLWLAKRAQGNLLWWEAQLDSWIRCWHDTCHHQGEGVRIHLGLQVQSPFLHKIDNLQVDLHWGFPDIYIIFYTFIPDLDPSILHPQFSWSMATWLPQFPLKVDSVPGLATSSATATWAQETCYNTVRSWTKTSTFDSFWDDVYNKAITTYHSLNMKWWQYTYLLYIYNIIIYIYNII